MSKITILRNNVTVPEGKKYKVCELGYRTEDGKVKGMRILSFGDYKPIFDEATSAKPGDVMEAAFRQNDKGYWEFSTLKNTGVKYTIETMEEAKSMGSTIPQGSASTRGTWETPDERQARQVMIVRQSSLSTAQAMLEANKVKAEPEDVIKVAMMFESYVMHTGKEEVE